MVFQKLNFDADTGNINIDLLIHQIGHWVLSNKKPHHPFFKHGFLFRGYI
tara:strand:- start:5564 stop:5713 length:150 start_codon:yes stop_codon:yes gene_type:complete